MAQSSLNILMLHNRYLIRGGEDVSTDSQVELLRQHGHHVDLFQVSNERVAELGRVRTAARSIWSVESYRKIESLLEERSFDVMHVQNFFPLLSPSVYYAANRQGVPVVQSLRNFRLLCPEGMLHRDSTVCTDCVGKSFAWPSVQHKCYRNSRVGSATIAVMSAGHTVARTWKRKVFRYVTPSAYARQVFLDGGWDPELIDVIPNFVHPDPGEATGGGGFALFAGRLDPPKGVATLLRAWRESGTDFQLKIVGDGSLRSEVEAAVASEESIEYLGLVDSSQASQLMGEASFVVIPTTGIETFGRVAAEAMAKGTPPVVADHGGLSEIVADGETGLVFKPGDATSLAAAINRMTHDPQRLAEMRTKARSRFLDVYEGARVVDQWVNLYRSAMDSATG